MKFIPHRNVIRMFPFEFYKELNGVHKTYIPQNAIFTLEYTQHMDKLKALPDDEKRQIFYDYYNNQTKQLAENNIIEINGEHYLTLMPCVKPEHIDATDGGVTQQSELSFLAVQYFDSSRQGIFGPGVALSSIHQIPEILFDDPNLMIAVITFTMDQVDAGATMAVITLPEFLHEKYIIDNSEETQ